MQTRSDSVQSFLFCFCFFVVVIKKVTMEKDNTQGNPMCLLASRPATHDPPAAGSGDKHVKNRLVFLVSYFHPWLPTSQLTVVLVQLCPINTLVQRKQKRKKKVLI